VHNENESIWEIGEGDGVGWESMNVSRANTNVIDSKFGSGIYNLSNQGNLHQIDLGLVGLDLGLVERRQQKDGNRGGKGSGEG
jgi:hypothetical protein